MAVTFMAEISRRVKLKPQFTPDESVSRQYGIYWLYTGAWPQNTYWTDWGGVYDSPVTETSEIRFREWLFPVTSMADLLAVENSRYTAAGFLYVHVPRHTWLYPEAEVTMAEQQPYLSGPKRADNPSDMVLNGNYAEARLAVPGVGIRLSDVISGITLLGSFNIALDNHDGKFDGTDALELFNSPAQLRKAVAEYPEYADFYKIREGTVENVRVDSGKITLAVADKFRALDSQACGLVNAEDYPVEKTDALGKPLPVAFGTVTMPLIEIAYTETESGDSVTVSAKYLAAEYISSFSGLYAEDGTGLPYSLEGAVISFSRTSAKDAKLKPKYAKFTGYAANRLGEIVKRLVAKEANMQYVPSVWDVPEADQYINSSPRLNLAVTSGDIKAAVQTVLKSGMAYLIQKNDGLFTLRKWGTRYAEHEIPEWLITAQPEKDFSDAEKNYFSSCVVKGKYSDYAKDYGESYVYRDTEEYALDRYTKNRLAEYETRLAETADMRELAASLAGRFSGMKDTVRVSVGADTSRFNLLDTVIMKIAVNGRNFSDNERWIVKEIDPAQDRLVLEAV